jgi:hypothetical protein
MTKGVKKKVLHENGTPLLQALVFCSRQIKYIAKFPAL